MAKHPASANHVYKAELVKTDDGKRIMRLFDNRDSARAWASERETDGPVTVKRLKVND